MINPFHQPLIHVDQWIDPFDQGKKERKKKSLDFVSPEYQIKRKDTDELRKKILSIPYAQWKKRGFSKVTLHYMKKNAKSEQPFSLNKHVRKRLDQWDSLYEICTV